MRKTKIRMIVGVVVILILLIGGYFLLGAFKKDRLDDGGVARGDGNLPRRMNSSGVNSSLMEKCREDSSLGECFEFRSKIEGIRK